MISKSKFTLKCHKLSWHVVRSKFIQDRHKMVKTIILWSHPQHQHLATILTLRKVQVLHQDVFTVLMIFHKPKLRWVLKLQTHNPVFFLSFYLLLINSKFTIIKCLNQQFLNSILRIPSKICLRWWSLITLTEWIRTTRCKLIGGWWWTKDTFLQWCSLGWIIWIWMTKNIIISK